MKTFRLENLTGCKVAVSVLFFVLALQMGTSHVWADDLVRRVQEALVEKGYDPGPVDGVWGSKTQAQIKRFQGSEGLSPSGELDGDTKSRLFASMGDSTPAAAVSPPSASAERTSEGDTGPDVPGSLIVWGRHK